MVSSHTECKAFGPWPQKIACPISAVCVIRFAVGLKSAVAAGGRSCHQSPKNSTFTPPNDLSLAISQCRPGRNLYVPVWRMAFRTAFSKAPKSSAETMLISSMRMNRRDWHLTANLWGSRAAIAWSAAGRVLQ